jgi:prevent-host-death family protein
MIVEIEQAEEQLEKLFEEVGLGEVVVITRHGKPVARLVPPADEPTGERVPGSAKGL